MTSRRAFLAGLLAAPLVPVAALVRPTALHQWNVVTVGNLLVLVGEPLTVTWSIPNDPTSWDVRLAS